MRAPWHRQRQTDPWDWSCLLDVGLGVLLVVFAFVVWYLINNA